MNINNITNNLSDNNINLTKSDNSANIKDLAHNINQKDSFTKAESTSSSFMDKLKNIKGMFSNLVSIATAATDYSLYTAENRNKFDIERKELMRNIKPGDVLLSTNSTNPVWAMIEHGADYTHASIYEGDGKLLEAIGDGGVSRANLSKYFDGKFRLEVIRPPYKSEADKNAALDYARSKLGAPYDLKFDYNKSDDKFYCSALVAKSLRAMPHRIDVPTTSLFGKEVVLPTGFEKVKDGKIIYSDNYTFLKGTKNASPAFIGGAAAAAAGGFVLGPIGAIAGFVAGTLATSVVGGHIQSKNKYSIW